MQRILDQKPHMMWDIIPFTPVSLFPESAKALIQTAALRPLKRMRNVIIKLKQILLLVQEVIK